MTAAPKGYEDIRALALALGCRVPDLLAQPSTTDPFYAGIGFRRRNAEWFAGLWEQFGPGVGVHLRRLHYRIFSADPRLLKPDGMPYGNTVADWGLLLSASLSARYLGLVPEGHLVDRRAADPSIFASAAQAQRPWVLTIDSGRHDVSAVLELPAEITLPKLIVGGFEPAQPYLVEVWIEKSTMNDVLEPLAERLGFNLVAGVGQISEIHCRQFIERVEESQRPARLLYVSDFDPAGRTMPVAVARKIEFYLRQRDLGLDIRLEPIVLTAEQGMLYALPRQPMAEPAGKAYATQGRRFEEQFGQGVTELDALEALHPGELARIVTREVNRFRDPGLRTRAMTARSRRQEEAYAVSAAVLSDHAEAIAAVQARYEELRGQYDELRQRISEIDDEASELRTRIAADMEERAPDPAEWKLPAPRVANEHDNPLFDSRRDYLTQLSAYKVFQGKAAALEAEEPAP